MLRPPAGAPSTAGSIAGAVLLLAAATGFVGLATTAPLAGQPWAGSAGVGVEVRGDGRPIPDARVELAWLGGRQLSGPGAVLTDSSGRAAIGALAEGRWLLRIRHPEFMGYDAELEVESGRKPRETRATVTKVGDSTIGLRIGYFKVEGPTGDARPAPPIDPPAATPSARSAGRDAPARTPGEEPSEPDNVAEDEPAPRPMPEPESARLVPSATDVPTAPAVSRNVRSSRGGGCFDCRPGEWATHTQGEPRPPSGPACPRDLAELAAGLTAALAAEAGSELDRYAGPLLPLEDTLPAARRALTPLAAPYDTGCQILALKLPEGARLGGLQMELATPRQSAPCLPDGECPGRTGRFAVVPRIEHTDFGTIVVGAFEHTAESREVPRLTVYFQPAGDWSP
ncbi:MAG TPA: hypothetical protein VMT85_22890 [Thermoanaerobaculia bacterium]|nr:hypothetical protein [Thermoanaerobaculia bacterium]